jgi:hypothetical protein
MAPQSEGANAMSTIGNQPRMADPGAALFVDVSNVFIGARDAAAARDEDPRAIRICAERLGALMACGRSTSERVALMNARVPDAVQQRFRRSFEVISVEPGAITGSEQTNDSRLQVRMWQAPHAHQPGTIVLASGDGNGWTHGEGFLPPLVAARKMGWALEIVAWRASLNQHLRARVAMLGGSIVYLDDNYEQVTFIEGGRRMRPMILTRRPSSDPDAAVPIAV